MKKNKIFLFVVAFFLCAVIFYAGIKVGTLEVTSYPVNAEEQNKDLSLFWDVVTLLKEKHIDGSSLDDQKILYGAIEGAVGALNDPYSEFFSPQNAEKFNEDLSGIFGGIGAEIGIKESQLMIISPLKGNPAEKVGLKAGDKIIKINEKLTSGINIDDAIKLIRGEPGTVVTLLIFRDGWKVPQEFKITRAIVNVPTLEWEMKPGNIAYFKLYNFNANLIHAWNTAAAQAIIKQPKGIILDVRNNPGGFLDVSTEILGWFLKRGDIVLKERFHSNKEKSIYANGNEVFSRIPVVVLINEGSASASEILAGALRDKRGAKIIGKKSFGKGSVQEVETLQNGAMVKISIAEWLTPNGNSINKVGIKPDIEISITEKDEKQKSDPQLKKALEIITSQVKK